MSMATLPAAAVPSDLFIGHGKDNGLRFRVNSVQHTVGLDNPLVEGLGIGENALIKGHLHLCILCNGNVAMLIHCGFLAVHHRSYDQGRKH